MPWPIYSQGKSLHYPFDRKLGGYQSQSGHDGGKKQSLPLPGNKPQPSHYTD